MKNKIIFFGVCATVIATGLYINKPFAEGNNVYSKDVAVVQEQETQEEVQDIEKPTNDLSEHSETLEGNVEVGLDDVERESDKVVIDEKVDVEDDVNSDDEIDVEEDESLSVNEPIAEEVVQNPETVEDSEPIQEVVVESIATETTEEVVEVEQPTESEEVTEVAEEPKEKDDVVVDVIEEDETTIVEEPVIQEPVVEAPKEDVVVDNNDNNSNVVDGGNDTWINENGEEVIVNEDLDNLKPGDYTTANGVFLKPVQYGGDMGGGRGDIELGTKHGINGEGAQFND